MSDHEGQSPAAPSGIGGWLIPFGMLLIVQPFLMLRDTFRSQSGPEGAVLMLTTLLMVGQAALFLYRSRWFVAGWTWSTVAILVAAALVAVVLDAPWKVWRDVYWPAVAIQVLWGAYLHNSRRVANTFVR